MIYIDGNHDLEVVVKDWEHCSRQVKPGGVIVMDDAATTTTYRPPCFSSAGWPGPSQVAQEIDRARFREILQVGHNRVFQRLS
jgi:predicted O-methyltransferase YrrM